MCRKNKTMAGWLEIENDSSDVKDYLNTLQEPKNPKKQKVLFDLDKKNNGNGKWTFDEFLKTFFDEIYGVSCLRPLPPVIGEGETVDLLKLRISVRKRGGYCSVSKNGLWRSVASDCGFDFRVAAALKLVYVKYFDSLDIWLGEIEQHKGDGGSGIEELYLGFRRVLMELESSKVEKEDDQMSDSKKRKRESCVGILNWIRTVARDPVGPAVEPLPGRRKWKSYGSDLQWKQILAFREAVLLKKNVNDQMSDSKKRKRESSLGILNWIRTVAKDPVGPAVEPLPLRRMWKRYGSDLQWKQILAFREAVLLKKNVDDQVSDSKKRKRESCLGILNWIHTVANDPVGPAVEPLPLRQMWKSYGSESSDLPWKQILAFREAVLLKKYVDGGSQQWDSQKKQRMHPSMYKDDKSSPKRSRVSPRIIASKYSSRKAQERSGNDPSSSSSQSDEDSADNQSDIHISPEYQAELPDLQGVNYESEDKWLGTKIWPLEESEERKIAQIERYPIRRVRQESCRRQFANSLECVRFRVGEKNMKLKDELGSAYYSWRFHNMGEDVALSWTREEQSKFQLVVQSSRRSSSKIFLQELSKNFPEKRQAALISYYFNVFLLRRRGLQNRTRPDNINSDDEGSNSVPVGNRYSSGSILSSPSKSPPPK